MQKLLHTVIALLVLAFALPATGQEAQEDAPAQAPQAVALRPDWSEGQSARYEFWGRTQKDEQAQVLGRTQDKRTVYITEGQIAWTVGARNADGTIPCTMHLDKIKFTIKSGDAEAQVIDSENPTGQSAVFDRLVAAMVGTPLTVTVNADGTIGSIAGIDAMNDAAGEEARKAEMVPEEIDFKETASDLATLIAAPASATPGQTWNAKNTWNHESVIPGTDTKGDWDTTFTLDSVSEVAGVPIATVKSVSKIDMKVDLSMLPEQSPDVDVQIKGAAGKGEVLFDLLRKETVARNDSMTYTAYITINPPNDRVPPIKITVTETTQSQLLRIGEGADEE